MSDRFDKFTERAKKAMMLAQEEALRFNHNYIGTEHLLIGVAAEGQGVGARLLKDVGVDLPRLREALTFIIGRGKDAVEGDISLTPRAKLVVDRAIDEARVLRHGYVGTEHLLLGAAHPGIDGISVRMLEHCGVDVHALRRATLDLLAGEAQRLHGASSESGTPPPATARPRDNVVTCRVDDQTLGALDALVEAGVHSTRSEAAARLILAGIQANQPLFQRVNDAVAEIRRVRAETQALVRMWEEGGSVESAPVAEAGEASHEAESEQRENRDAGRKRPDAGQIREAEPGTQQAGA